MRALSLLFIGLLALPGCTPSSKEAERGNSPAVQVGTPSGKTEGTEVRFTNARIFIPSESDRNNPEYLLAPIIVHQTTGGSNAAYPGWRGEENKNPRVCLTRSEVEINGAAHPQFTYSWQYGDPSEDSETHTGMIRTLRMTIDSSGYPAVYEILAGNGKVMALHVSRGLEQKSSQEHGQPLPGRKYSVESGPGVEVAGLVEDGPLALGPLVYVSLDGNQIVSLSCRCSPSRIDKADGSHRYDLVNRDPDKSELPDTLPPPDQALGKLRLPGKF